MFSELVESVAVRKATSKRWSFLVSIAFQCGGLIILILLPLIWTQALPAAMMVTLLVAPAAPAAPAPPAPTRVATETVQRSVRMLDHGELHEPRAIPAHAKVFVEPELPPETTAGLGAAGDVGTADLLHSFSDDSNRVAPVAPAPPASKTPERIQQGGVVQAAKIISQPQPVYPVLAVQGRIQGNVVLRAIIGRDGRVSELQVISGHPLLVKAALDAVGQRRYQATLLNGEPVEVDTTITVSFVLGG